jgi:hypothetical protein
LAQVSGLLLVLVLGSTDTFANGLSGEWKGTWTSDGWSTNPRGDIFVSLIQLQNGNRLRGDVTVTGTDCGFPFGPHPLNGMTSGNSVEFSVTIPSGLSCVGALLSFGRNPPAMLTGNTISGRYTFLFNAPSDSGTFVITRSRVTITAAAGSGGTISPSGVVHVSVGASQTFTITPATDFSISDVLVDGLSVGAAATFTFSDIDANYTIEAQFGANKIISARSGPNGAISPSGDIVVTEGADQLFTITPDPGYLISDVIVDEVSVGAVRSFTFPNVTSAHTIETSFSEVYPAIAPALQLLVDD